MKPTIEQTLAAAFAPHGVTVRAFRASFHDQKYWGASNRIKGFYVRRDPLDAHGRVQAHYDISKRHPWPTKTQVEDPEWLTSTVDSLLAELDADRDISTRSKWAIYCRCGGMPNEGRDQQPYNSQEEAEAALQRGRKTWADSASIARIQWNNARVLPYTGDRTEPFRDEPAKIDAFALRYIPTGKYIERRSHPGQTETLTLACLFDHQADASFARSQLSTPEYYDCKVADIEIVPVRATLETS